LVHLTKAKIAPFFVSIPLFFLIFKGLLNKLTVDNFPVVADQVATIFANITDWDLLKELLDLLLDKAFNEPDFSQLYADLCLVC
jgi:translation initiation factor 4G